VAVAIRFLSERGERGGEREREREEKRVEKESRKKNRTEPDLHHPIPIIPIPSCQFHSSLIRWTIVKGKVDEKKWSANYRKNKQ